jgi:restriction system protein
MKVLDAVEQVLSEAGRPLAAREIARRAIDRGLWQTEGKTPHDTVHARLAVDISKRGAASRFERVAPGTFALRAQAIPDATATVPPAEIFPTNSTGEASVPSDTTEGPAVPQLLGAPPLPVLDGKSEPIDEIPTTTMSFTDATEHVLRHESAGQPMHYRAITQRALGLGLLRTAGHTPEATLYAQVLTEIDRKERRGEAPRFVKLGKGLIDLARLAPRGLAAQIEQQNREVRKALHARLQRLSPGEFETLIGELLVKVGFADVEVTRLSGDNGIDVRGTLVVGEVIRTRMAVQVKRWKANVQAPEVQKVRGSLGTHDQGLIITTSDFSAGARTEAARPNAVPVALMNGEQLVALLVQHDIGVRRRDHVLLELVDGDEAM